MKLTEAQSKFIQTWGVLGGNWGINKTMAQIHALLMAWPDPLCTEDMMEILQISRGNTNMNARSLMDWGLVTKEMISGDRKDYYTAKKDIWVIARQIAKERRKRELEPVLSSLKDIRQSLKSDPSPENIKFTKQVEDIENFTLKVDQSLDKFIQSDENWFLKLVMKMV
jgi:DNA-binding transcriptional regulator GbsR (MarR family)